MAVQETLRLDPFNAYLYVFQYQQREKLKFLYWHHNGYVLLYKRLERRRFVWPAHDMGEPLCVNVRKLHALLDGSDISELLHVEQLHYQ